MNYSTDYSRIAAEVLRAKEKPVKLAMPYKPASKVIDINRAAARKRPAAAGRA